jgi:AcrR family transcriptional regulator
VKADQKQQRIVEASAALLLRQGIRKTNMEDIAANACVSKVTVYKYFGDRDGVLNAVCFRLIDCCLQALTDQIEASTDTVTRMMGFINVLSGFIRSGEQVLCSELGKASSVSAKHYRVFEEKTKDMIYSLIREGKGAHLIDESLSDEVIYHYIEMGLCYYTQDTLYRERMWVDTSFRQEFLHLIWRNIFNGESHQKIET